MDNFGQNLNLYELEDLNWKLCSNSFGLIFNQFSSNEISNVFQIRSK